MSASSTVIGAVGILRADAVQEEVHDAEPRRRVDDLPAAQRLVAEGVLPLVGVEHRVARDVVVCGEEEAARAAGGIADPHPRLGLHHLDDRPDQRPGREVLTGTGFHVLRVPLEQPLVGVALDVHAEREPRLLVDQVGDQPPQERGFWILFWALRKTTPVMPDFLPSSSRMCR